jgi:hypothetical protein
MRMHRYVKLVQLTQRTGNNFLQYVSKFLNPLHLYLISEDDVELSKVISYLLHGARYYLKS